MLLCGVNDVRVAQDVRSGFLYGRVEFYKEFFEYLLDSFCGEFVLLAASKHVAAFVSSQVNGEFFEEFFADVAFALTNTYRVLLEVFSFEVDEF